MKRLFIVIVYLFLFNAGAEAQDVLDEYSQDAEFGITAGVAQYFGDLNPTGKINRPKAAIGGYFRKQISNYIAFRLSGHYAQLGYSDRYSSNEYQQRRNLSFNTSIFELALQGDFNFFKFIPTDPSHAFTPYATLGIGMISYDPYAYLDGQKYYLRPLHTEGQTFYEGRKPYGSIAVCFPIGMGIKYAINDKINLSLEVGYRFTTTDYIDDVSKTYVGVDKFPNPGGGKNVAALLQDRSYETGTPIGIEGRQRGFSKQNDSYAIAEVGLSINLTSYRCPTSR